MKPKTFQQFLNENIADDFSHIASNMPKRWYDEPKPKTGAATEEEWAQLFNYKPTHPTLENFAKGILDGLKIHDAYSLNSIGLQRAGLGIADPHLWSFQHLEKGSRDLLMSTAQEIIERSHPHYDNLLNKGHSPRDLGIQFSTNAINRGGYNPYPTPSDDLEHFTNISMAMGKTHALQLDGIDSTGKVRLSR